MEAKEYEFGVMSSSYTVMAENKLTAYVCMCAFYDRQNHLIALYGPDETKSDCWMSLDGKVSERLDEIFGGEGAFDKYAMDNIDSIKIAYKTIKRKV